MARTVAATRPDYGTDSETPRPYVFHGERGESCEFCRTRTVTGVHHELCPVEINTSKPGHKDNKTWQCRCALQGHQEGQ